VLHGCCQFVLSNVLLSPRTNATLKLYFLVQFMISVILIEDRRTPSRHGLDELGYTRTTMIITVGSDNASWSYSLKIDLSSNCFLKLKNMKVELLVIGYHNDPVNLEPGLVHTARHAKKVHCALHIRNCF